MGATALQELIFFWKLYLDQFNHAAATLGWLAQYRRVNLCDADQVQFFLGLCSGKLLTGTRGTRRSYVTVIESRIRGIRLMRYLWQPPWTHILASDFSSPGSMLMRALVTLAYCTISTKCSRGVTRHLRCSFSWVFIPRQSWETYHIW
jgi:hypothetical protein